MALIFLQVILQTRPSLLLSCHVLKFLFRISDRKGFLFRFDVNPTIPKVWLKAGFLPSDLNKARFKRTRLLAVKSVCQASAEILVLCPSCVPGFSRTRHDRPVKKAIVDLRIRLKGKSKQTSGNSFEPRNPGQNKELGAASQTLLTESETQAKLNWLRGHSRFNYSDTCWSVLKLFSMTV